MLSDLPSEIIYHIATYLPTANALAHLAQTCHRLNRIITAEDSRIFRAFVQSRFPAVETPPFWKDAAQALTSRSRALDRKAIIGRFVVPSETAIKIGCHEVSRSDNPTLGYRPVIDSYEVWNGKGWADRKEVLAWGAANQLVMRIKQTGAHPQEKWVMFNDVEDVSSYDDISSLHLLSSKPGHSHETDVEHLIFGRIRGDIAHIAISPKDATHIYKKKFLTYGLKLDNTDLSDDRDPVLAAHFDNGSIALYHTATDKEQVEPFTWLRPDGTLRNKYSKLLSPSLVAVSTGDIKESLCISKVTPNGISPYRTISVDSLNSDFTSLTRKANIGAIEPLNTHPLAGPPGEVFLAAWDDFTVRLHDLRSPRPYEVAYKDITDLNPIYSLHTFGHNHFLAGAGGDAVVKIFDMRMCNTYSYLDAQVPIGTGCTSQSQTNKSKPNTNTNTNTNGKDTTNKSNPHSQKDFSVFLSNPAPLPPTQQNTSRTRRRLPYRGPIYTMSTPSPSSPTVYTGIVDGIVRLDFASTDDLTGSRKGWYEDNLELGLNTGPGPSSDVTRDAIDLAGYERPNADSHSTTTVTSKLRNQRAFWEIPSDEGLEIVTGWDRRWEPLEEAGAWRRRD
jgi:WD40 repeat protein